MKPYVMSRGRNGVSTVYSKGKGKVRLGKIIQVGAMFYCRELKREKDVLRYYGTKDEIADRLIAERNEAPPEPKKSKGLGF